MTAHMIDVPARMIRAMLRREEYSGIIIMLLNPNDKHNVMWYRRCETLGEAMDISQRVTGIIREVMVSQGIAVTPGSLEWRTAWLYGGIPLPLGFVRRLSPYYPSVSALVN